MQSTSYKDEGGDEMPDSRELRSQGRQRVAIALSLESERVTTLMGQKSQETGKKKGDTQQWQDAVFARNSA